MPDKPNYKPVMVVALIILVGTSLVYYVNPNLFTGLGAKFTDSYIVLDSIQNTPSNAWVGENVTLTINILNEGIKTGTRQIQVIYDGALIQETSQIIESHQLKTLQFTVHSNAPGGYDLQINGLDRDFSYLVEVSEPYDSVLRRPDYYYSFAEEYVNYRYIIPEEHTIDDLSAFLNRLEFPVYRLDEFDCSDSSAMLEWLLEGAGFEAFIVKSDVHMWVQVETSNGLVAIEATNLCVGGGYSPPGIVEKTDGSFREYTAKHQRFIEWMETYPASEYGYDPEISFEEWKQEYLDLIDIPGIPTTSGYYKTGDRFFSPFNLYIGETTENVHTYSDETEFDWWNMPTFADQYPFKYW